MNLKSINTPKGRYHAATVVPFVIGLVLLFTIGFNWVWMAAYNGTIALFWVVNRSLGAKYGRHAKATAADTTRSSVLI